MGCTPTLPHLSHHKPPQLIGTHITCGVLATVTSSAALPVIASACLLHPNVPARGLGGGVPQVGSAGPCRSSGPCGVRSSGPEASASPSPPRPAAPCCRSPQSVAAGRTGFGRAGRSGWVAVADLDGMEKRRRGHGEVVRHCTLKAPDKAFWGDSGDDGISSLLFPCVILVWIPIMMNADG